MQILSVALAAAGLSLLANPSSAFSLAPAQPLHAALSNQASFRFCPPRTCTIHPLSRSSMPLRQPSRSGISALRAAASSGVDGVGVILLAGGVGSRMKAGKPKQFLELEGKPMLMHSLDLFRGLEGVDSITIVIAEEYRDMFDDIVKKDDRIRFAGPGKERQDSVFNGLQQVPDSATLVAVHDAARPLVTPEEVYNVFRDAKEHGAAVLAVPMKATVKESEDGSFVLRTIERSRLWEIHTPQVIRPDLLKKGFEKVEKEGLEVTDDVSIIEQLPSPVKITVGEYTNIKVTTPEDMPMAVSILKSRE
mmetsp:Transcript_18829/g.45247  ORF Transcript_18829/g.45247 Transcript_18829/m.45247 type:complete len:306 (-) Transcript_18829:251-1168(-)